MGWSLAVQCLWELPARHGLTDLGPLPISGLADGKQADGWEAGLADGKQAEC